MFYRYRLPGGNEDDFARKLEIGAPYGTSWGL